MTARENIVVRRPELGGKTWRQINTPGRSIARHYREAGEVHTVWIDEAEYFDTPQGKAEASRSRRPGSWFTFEPGNRVDREEQARTTALQAAKVKALGFLNAGDAAGCLVAFVAATLGPPSAEFTRPTIDWHGGSGSLLELGKLYIQPREVFPGFSVVDVEALRRWVVGFR